jgi:hypothetical protein
MPIVAVPWSEATEAADLAAGDVGISWIPDDLWSRGKCGLKVIQYQASGLAVVANPVGVHPELIDAGRSGLLAEAPEAWLAAVRQLAADPELRRRMGEAARADVAANYSITRWQHSFVAAATRGAASRESSAPTAAAWNRETAARQPHPGRAALAGLETRERP